MRIKTNISAVGSLSTIDYGIVYYCDYSLIHASSNYVLAVCYDDTVVDLGTEENR